MKAKKKVGLRSYLYNDLSKLKKARSDALKAYGAVVTVRRVTRPDSAKVEKFIYSALDEKTMNPIAIVDVHTSRKSITKGGEQKAINLLLKSTKNYRRFEQKILKEQTMKKNSYVDPKSKKKASANGMQKPSKKAESAVPGPNSINGKEKKAVEKATVSSPATKSFDHTEAWEQVKGEKIPTFDAFFADLWNEGTATATGFFQFCGQTFDLREFVKEHEGKSQKVKFWKKTVNVNKQDIVLIVHNG